jgi:hypothetical protein
MFAGHLNTLAAFHTTIADEIGHYKPKLHRTELPLAPRNWKGVQKHPYRDGFAAAATKEYKDLIQKGTFEPTLIDSVGSHFIIPMMWVFTYKFDSEGYLAKFKARIVVRGDLQRSSDLDTYAATLAAKVFRSLMAMAAHFDLDIWQFDAVNAFTNSSIDELVYVRYPEGMEEPGHCLKLLRALYGLPRSPLLWWNDLISKLRKLGLYPVPEASCLYSNDKLIVFFYIDNIYILCYPKNYNTYLQFRKALL